MPTCTVVVPCFNRADILGECLNSLIAQTFDDWEAVVVDDASTQGDVEAVVRGMHDPRFTFVRHEENRGPSAARNSGVRRGTGAMVFPLDDDDRLAPQCLERLTAVLIAEPEIDCVYPDLALFGTVTGVLQYGLGDERTLVEEQWLPGAGCLYRRSLWERVGGYCEDAALRLGHEDWEFYLAAAEGGFQARHVPEALYRYRVGSLSLSTRLQYHNYAVREFIYARHRGLFERYGARRPFLSAGYVASAEASNLAGERRRAFRLAWHAWILDQRRTAVAAMVRSLTPQLAISAARRVRTALRAYRRPMGQD